MLQSRRCPTAREPHAAAPARRVACSAVAAPTLTLKRASLGKLNVTEVCLGTMTFGEQTDEKEAHRQLSYAADMGVNFLDTAEMYPVVPKEDNAGETSRIIGRWFARGGARRADWVIASKVTGRAPGMEWITSLRTDPPGPRRAPRLDRENIRAAVHGELRRLQTDYIDLLYLHWTERQKPGFGRTQYNPALHEGYIQMTGGEPYASFDEQVDAVGELIKEGKVREWGLSNENTYGLMAHCHAADTQGVARPVSLTNCYNVLTRSLCEGELAEAMYYMGIGLVPWSVLAGGALTGKYLEGAAAPPGTRFADFATRYERFNSDRVKVAVAKYAALAQEVGLTPAQLSLAFCRSRWFVPSTIVGARTLGQLKENLDTWALTGPQGLPADVMERIQAIHMEQRDPTFTD